MRLHHTVIFLCLALAGIFSGSLYAQPLATPTGQAPVCSHSRVAHKRAAGIAVAGGSLHVQQLRLALRLNPEIDSLSGSATICYQCWQARLDTLALDLHDSMEVDSVTRGSRHLQWHRRVQHQLHIALGHSLAMHDRDTVTVWYHGRPAASGFGSFMRQDHATGPAVWTLSEPYGSRDWRPARMNLLDKADSLYITLLTPARYTSVANGLLVADTLLPDGWRSRSFVHRHPIADYLVAVAASNYALATQTMDAGDDTAVPVRNYLFPQDSAAWLPNIAACNGVGRSFGRLFGRYPFADEQYGHAQTLMGGAMEHQTITFTGTASLEVLCHELAHHWYGNLATCGSWQDIWLNEGFACYIGGYGLLLAGDTAAFYQFLEQTNGYATQLPGQTVWVQDTSDFGRIFSYQTTYSKGAFVLRQLHTLLGDSVFFRSLRRYLALAAPFSRMQHLQQALQEETGQDWEPYFRRWVYGTGHPEYTLAWQQKDGVLHLQLWQQWAGAVPDSAGLPLQLVVQGQDGQTDTLMLTGITAGGPQQYAWATPWPVRQVLVDPMFKTVRTVQASLPRQPNDATVFPNPSTGKFQVFVPSEFYGKELMISILSSSGCILDEKLLFNTPPVINLALPQHYTPGIYVLILTLTDGSQIIKRLSVI